MSDLFSATLQKLGFSEADVYQGTLRTGDKQGPTYLSDNPKYESAIPAKAVVFNTVDDLKALVGQFGGSGASPLAIPAPWPQNDANVSVLRLSEEQEQSVFAALKAFLAGKGDEVESYTDIVNERYFPMKTVGYAAQNVVVSPGNPLIIQPEGHDPVPVTIDTLTLEEGGQIICEAAVILTVTTFNKN